MTALRWGTLTLLLVLSATLAHANDVLKADWRLEGFANPESTLVGPAGEKIYVSNVNGAPTEKDGNGFISQVSLDGKMLNQKWATGLNAPKGMAVVGDTLFVADIDEIVAIEVASGKIRKKYPADGAKFLNDIAVDSGGRVYVSDMAANIIWQLDGDTVTRWLESADLKSPNGLVIKGDKLIVGCWGVMTNGFATDVPGHLLSVSLADKTISNLGSGASVGNLDGLEILSDTEFLATDWMAGKVLKINASGTAETVFDLNQGSADLGYSAARKMIFVPMMKDSLVLGFKLPGT